MSSAENTLDIVSIGQVSLDTIHNDQGTAVNVPGGGALYVAAITAALGAKTALVSRVGEDFADDTITQLQRLGIDLRAFQKMSGPSTRITLHYYGEHLEQLSVVTGVGEDITVEDLPESFLSSAIMHIGPAPYDTQILLIEEMIQRGGKISFAPHDDLKGSAFSRIRRLLQDVDILFANESEMLSMSGEQNLSQAVRALRQMGPSLIIATQGSKGATVLAHNKTFFIPALKATRTLDYVGAGDAFAAGFLVALINSFPLVACGVLGAAVASCIIEDFGLIPPTRNRVKQVLNNNLHLLLRHRLASVIPDSFFQEVA